MKNNFLFTILFALFAAGLTITANAQSVTIPDVSSSAGSNELVPVNVDGLANVGSISLYIEFDESVVTFNGITNVWSGAITTFSNVIPGNPSIIALSWFDFTGSGVDFPNGKYLDLDLTFNGGYSDLVFNVNCQITDAGSNIIATTFNNGSISEPAIMVDLKVFLQGPYDVASDEMLTALNDGAYIPLAQPYNPTFPYYDIASAGDINWVYAGTESVTSIPADVVDWIVVELRDAGAAATATGATMIGRQACFLLKDGSVVGLDGSSLPQFFTTFDQKAFIVIWHRNHLGIINASPASKSVNTYSYDYTTGEAQVYGGANGHTELEPGVWGMIAGDGNGNGLVQNTDETAVWKTDLGSSGYTGGDFDMNGLTQNTDETDIWKPNLGGGGQIPAKLSISGFSCQVPQ